MSSNPPILRPRPRRPFELNMESPSPSPSTSEFSSARPLESNTQNSSEQVAHSPTSPSILSGSDRNHDATDPPSRTRSVMNLTSSTLVGIFGPSITTSESIDVSEAATPWSTGAETPAHRMSGWDDDSGGDLTMSYSGGHAPGTEVNPASLRDRLSHISSCRRSGASSWKDYSSARSSTNDRREEYLRTTRRTSLAGPGGRTHKVSASRRLSLFFLRTTALFIVGTLYGSFISHLHDNQNLTPVPMSALNSRSWAYLAFWGTCGVLWGKLLPWVDRLWAEKLGKDWVGRLMENSSGRAGERGQLGWPDFVRGVGAFVGIAFAIRKLPWTSTTQASVTLSLANPVLWYLLDRTSAGLALSSVVGLAGTVVLLLTNAQLVPGPTSSFSQFGNSSATSAIVGGGLIRGNGTLEWASWKDRELIGVATWFSSVLFCSCVCFGNVGRLGRKWTAVGRQ
ncbi:hypothetical protein P152DRAFT_471077 [Eremomyces bilateralis CBS 781.70]|uniref:INSIG-domain-containing protein n=1 Tax=Eremomyces bilateralis CBS 781.70 TaxID=1392243 RepID=A0A6G1GCT3_9PEZI|nr:uncharacterized protein P152DRAFT_471077 [Eremomyces bilateralis CBS 781.70]KAF1815669.1 hypothetical protein P152DRAFT_471077 [Eremomyces bilateralis CBS 781.70]